VSATAREAVPLAAVLLDLDGTLADTAGDLARAMDALRGELGLPPMAPGALRPYVSQGARGMLTQGLDLRPDDARYVALRDRFLELYAGCCAVEAQVFEGFGDALAALRGCGLRIGIVTNKMERFAAPLLRALGVAPDAGCLITPDQLAKPKPDPEGVLLACARLGALPAQCVFVGDDRRDIEAGRAAGTRTAIAAWGYLPPGEDIHAWGADAIVAAPVDLPALCRRWGAA
jgi:phosphoglycolate phosphatase